MSDRSSSPTSSLVWFITGASSGFGRSIADAALGAGHQVVATARNTDSLDDIAASSKEGLLCLPLDVTDDASVTMAVEATTKRFGHIDVLVNNAGYALRGALEELSLADLREQYETNVFGVVRVTQAVLPGMRAQRSGHIIMMSSVGGVSTTLGGTAYGSIKFALERLSEGLAAEAAPFGIRITIVEPGPFRTDFAGRSVRWSEPLEAYAPHVGQAKERFIAQHGQQTR